MGLLKLEVFVCLDCETTGLDVEQDRIIEVALSKFTFDSTLESFETLIDPECLIPESSREIHKISQDMVMGKPKVTEVLPQVFSMLKHHIVVGHGIAFDLKMLEMAAKRACVPSPLENIRSVDTLRLARLYGESPTNSLEILRRHFNIEAEGAHRAMSDVKVNIEVFKHLVGSFKTTEQLLQRLEKPILLKTMPLGKHKGRRFDEIPIDYLQWAANKDFDQDLLYSIRLELKNRKRGNQFEQASNPFSHLL
jgi:DNA polymerase-3 subunit epsilon